MPLGLTLRKSRLLTSFSFSRSNRIGSDDKINMVSSKGDKCESIKRSSLERLRNELEVKDRTITELRKQLDGLSSHEIAFAMPKTPYQPGRRLNRLRLSGLTRSASIISIGAWIKGLSWSSRRRSVGDSSAESKEKVTLNCREIIEPVDMYRPQRSSLDTAPSVTIYSYGKLFEGEIAESELCLDHLEWHLDEEDLLEHLSICRDFLSQLDTGELFDRKYRASLTPEQYRHRRLSSLASHGTVLEKCVLS